MHTNRKLAYIALALAALCLSTAAAKCPSGTCPVSTRVTQDANWPPAVWVCPVPAIRADGERIVPIVSLTPGASDPTHDRAWLLVKDNVKKYRNVTKQEKDATYAEYKITQAMQDYGRQQASGPGYEVDHLLSIELGGSNAASNLWIEPYWGEWNARLKDHLEDHLGAMVKAGTIPLTEAQLEIGEDHWIESYLHYFGQPVYLRKADHKAAAVSMRP